MLNLIKISRPSAANQRAHLLKISVVAACRGVPAVAIYNNITEGRWRWVFNFAVNQEGALPDYRIWHREAAGEKVRRLTPETVIREIAGEEPDLKASQLCQMFSISRATVLRLREQLGGRLERTGAVFERDAVVRFLTERLCRERETLSVALN